MTERTPQQALKDAIDSGAVAAWIKGEIVQYHYVGAYDEDYVDAVGMPTFTNPYLRWRPKPFEPQKPTRADWRPVVSGQEPSDPVLVWIKGRKSVDSGYFFEGRWYYNYSNDRMDTPPSYYAPEPSPPLVPDPDNF